MASAQALFTDAQKKEQAARKAVVVAMIRIQGQFPPEQLEFGSPSFDPCVDPPAAAD